MTVPKTAKRTMVPKFRKKSCSGIKEGHQCLNVVVRCSSSVLTLSCTSLQRLGLTAAACP